MIQPKNQTQISRSFLFKLTCRTSLFLALMLLALITFYLSGNYQNFLDSTQMFILFLSSADCVILFLFSIAGTMESATLFFISRKKRYWIFFALYVLGIVVSAGLFIVLRILSMISFGYEAP